MVWLGFFRTHKGLRQEDPLPPLLFDLIADVLALMIETQKSV